MKVIYTKSKWEVPDLPLEEFVHMVMRDEFDGVELYLPDINRPAREIGNLLAENGLSLVAQIATHGATPDQHIECMKRRFAFAAECEPLLVNSHTGRDIFNFAENCRIYEAACELAEEYGLTFVHELHRGRPTFNAMDTRRYLEAIPQLLLTADFSHWFCAHESDLSDQKETVYLAIQRSRHIHARVGFSEGPQVPDPWAPMWWPTTLKFLSLWQQVIDCHVRAGMEVLTITPEFGPPPYMPCDPVTEKPIADAWKINAQFLSTLKQHLYTHEYADHIGSQS